MERIALAILLAAAMFIAAPATAMYHETHTANPAMAKGQKVKIAENSADEKYLTDSKGMTLYWFKMDSMNKSACAGSCETNWPVFYRKNVAAGKGLSSDDFDTIKRSDGKMQTTFRGYPLYYFVKDKMKGDDKGHMLKDVWFRVDPDNFPMK